MVGEEASVGKCPSVDVMDHHYSDLMRRMSTETSRSRLVFGVANLFVGTGDIGVDFANLGLFTSGLATPCESGQAALRHNRFDD